MYVAAVGARFEVPGRIEFQDIVVDKKQNVQSNGYGEENREGSVLSIFAKFYGKNDFPVYEEALQHPCKYEVVKSANNDFLFDKEAYTSRIQLNLDYIKDIDFSWINKNDEITELQDIHFSRRNAF